jgi:hypothetical protein
VARATPPLIAPEAWLRKYSRSSAPANRTRVRSPSSAPPVTGLDGSIASTATRVSPADRSA